MSRWCKRLRSLGIALPLGAGAYYLYHEFIHATSIPENSVLYSEHSRIKKIIESVPSLEEKYVPPIFASNPWLNIALFVMKQKFHAYFSNYDRQVIKLDDGGTVSIDYTTASLPEDAPIVICLHTLNGCGASHFYFVKYAASRGWRGVVLNRRGHGGMKLTTGQFNCFGNPSDTNKMIQIVKKKYPKSRFVAMAGLSAGSGQCVNYLGCYGDHSLIDAAASLCPAYDIRYAFLRLKKRNASLDEFLLKGMKRYFITPNERILRERNSNALEKCQDASSMHEFVEAHAPFACSTLDDAKPYTADAYFAEHNPMVSIPFAALTRFLLRC